MSLDRFYFSPAFPDSSRRDHAPFDLISHIATIYHVVAPKTKDRIPPTVQISHSRLAVIVVTLPFSLLSPSSPLSHSLSSPLSHYCHYRFHYHRRSRTIVAALALTIVAAIALTIVVTIIA